MKDLKGRISRDLLLNLELHIFDSQALDLYASSWGHFLWKCLRARRTGALTSNLWSAYDIGGILYFRLCSILVEFSS